MIFSWHVTGALVLGGTLALASLGFASAHPSRGTMARPTPTLMAVPPSLGVASRAAGKIKKAWVTQNSTTYKPATIIHDSLETMYQVFIPSRPLHGVYADLILNGKDASGGFNQVACPGNHCLAGQKYVVTWTWRPQFGSAYYGQSQAVLNDTPSATGATTTTFTFTK